MYERQDSNSKLHIMIHMESPFEESPCTCTSTYEVPGIFTFQNEGYHTSAENADITKETMSGREDLTSSFQYNTKEFQQNDGRKEIVSPCVNLFEESSINKDDKIFEAVNEALSSGSLTPLIKEELKCSIQARRLKEGKHELKVEFSEPKEYELTEEEVVKVENRRIQNRVAAQRFRERQKQNAEQLQRKCHRIESHNTQLKYELKKLREEKENLRKTLEDHLKVCPLMSQHLFPSLQS